MTNGSPKKSTTNKHKITHARVGSTLTNGGDNEPPQTERKNDSQPESSKKHNNTIVK